MLGCDCPPTVSSPATCILVVRTTAKCRVLRQTAGERTQLDAMAAAAHLLNLSRICPSGDEEAGESCAAEQDASTSLERTMIAFLNGPKPR